MSRSTKKISMSVRPVLTDFDSTAIFKSFNLSPDHISTLRGLSYAGSNSKFLVGDPSAFYEVLSLIQLMGENSAIDYLTSRKFIDLSDLIFNSKLFQSAREAEEIQIELSRNKNMLRRGPPCRKCASTNTSEAGKQTRSADEPETIYFACFDCGYKRKD